MSEEIYKALAEQIDTFRCPITKSKLRLEGDQLISEVEEVRYPINDGIPVLLADQAVLPEGVSLEELKAKYA